MFPWKKRPIAQSVWHTKFSKAPKDGSASVIKQNKTSQSNPIQHRCMAHAVPSTETKQARGLHRGLLKGK